MKKLIRLTEADLHRIVKESVNNVLNEIGDTERGQYMLGRLGARKYRNASEDERNHTAAKNGRREEIYALKQQGDKGDWTKRKPSDAFQKGVDMQNKYMDAVENGDKEDEGHFRNMFKKHYNGFSKR